MITQISTLFLSILVWVSPALSERLLDNRIPRSTVASGQESSAVDLIVTPVSRILNFSPGKVESLQIRLSVPPKFHGYSDKLQIIDIQPSTFQVGQLQLDQETQFYDKFSKSNKMGFANESTATLQIEAPVDIDPATRKLSFSLKYQICSEKICYLPKIQNLVFDVRVSPDGVPVKANMKARLNHFIDQFEISNYQHNIYLTFLICFLAGILTSFTPCIFPMIPITISILGHDAEKNTRRQNFMRSAIYVLGIALTYATLGVLAALTGQLFGNLLANKYVLVGMALLFFTMALSMWGVFDLQVPAFIRNRFGTGKKQGYLGIFAMGLVAGIVASPCVGPVLVSILSYVSTTKDALLGFGLLFTYALGLGLIFMLIGLFGQALTLLPKSGAWMNKIKYVLGAVMVIMGVYYLQIAFPHLRFQKSESHSRAAGETTWHPYSDEQLLLARQNRQPVLIDFRADWCGACLELEEKTFSQPGFAALAREFKLLKMDATNESAEIEEILTKYDVKGLPTVLFLNRNGDVLKDLQFTQFIEWNLLEPKMRDALKEK